MLTGVWHILRSEVGAGTRKKVSGGHGFDPEPDHTLTMVYVEDHLLTMVYVEMTPLWRGVTSWGKEHCRARL